MDYHCICFYNSDSQLEKADTLIGLTSEVVEHLGRLGFTQQRPECTEHDRAICRNPMDGRWAIDTLASNDADDVIRRVVGINTALNTRNHIPQLNNELSRLKDASRVVS